METRRIISIIIILSLVILAIMHFRHKAPVRIDSDRRIIMGTFARVIVIADKKDTAVKAIESAFDTLEDIEKLASIYNPDSELSIVNSLAWKQPVKLSDNLYEIIHTALKYSSLTEGAFDVTIGPLIKLWNQAAEINQMPESRQLEEVRQRVGFEKIILNPEEKSIRFTTEGVKIDLGGIAKGYAIDKAIEAVKASGVFGALVDVGGDIRCFVTPPSDKEHWLIGLQEPEAEDEQSVLALKLTNSAVATSGDYRRFSFIEGLKHSHIINTQTGRSASGLSSVSIITENCVDADALATAVSVLGTEDGLALIDSLESTEAVIFSHTPDYQIVATKGAVNKLLDSGVTIQIYKNN